MDDREKLRLRYAELSDDELRAVSASTKTSELHRQVVDELLRGRSEGRPAPPSADSVSPDAGPRRPLAPVLIGAGLLLTGVGRFVMGQAQARQRNDELRAAALAQSRLRSGGSFAEQQRRAHEEIEAAFAAQRGPRRATWERRCAESAAECVAAAEFYTRGDFEHGQPPEPDTARGFRTRACAAGRREACEYDARAPSAPR